MCFFFCVLLIQKKLKSAFSSFENRCCLNAYFQFTQRSNMTKSFTPILITLLLIGGSFLTLSIPAWLTYTWVLSFVISLVVYIIYKNHHIFLLAWSFCKEFLGFCLLITLFVSTVVMMNGLITR